MGKYGNIVGQNMISIEHQLKSELEKPVECIEDRKESKMKKFEKTSVPRTIQPPTYDGQTPLSSYKKQLEVAAMVNIWEE